MKINNKYTKALLLSPVIFLISCGDMSETKEDTLAWDATNYIMYNEFMTCTAGDKYSQDALNEAIASWRGIEKPESMLGAWGYATVTDDDTAFNNWWELSWSSKEEADAEWQEWLASEEATAWGEKYSSVLQCDGENREGYEFLFPYNPYAFGDTPEDGSFSASFSPCTLNEGKSQEDFSNALIQYNSWLDNIDQSQTSGFYAYGIYFPDDAAADEDFWFANFHENLETMSEGNSLWEETGGDAKIQMEAASTCSAPEISNGQVFFDPGDPDFS
ncbi:hypothetical protein N9I12_01725 [Gammaproteobacteria bacterium]|nr:hypothetical protein [Gammaproteobacteria bacterium]